MRAREAHRAWEALPFADIDAIFGPGRVLILAPHADDESLGCGGLIAELCRLGRPPLVVVLTDGTLSHPGMPAAALRSLRAQEATSAVRELGLEEPGALVFLGLPDGAAPLRGAEFDMAAARLASLAAGCGAICATWGGDPHCDHVAADVLAGAAAAQAGLRHLCYPVWGWTLPDDRLLPDREVQGWRLDIAAALPRKQRAIAAHRSQHGGLAEADPSGFVLPSALLEVFQRPYEVFMTP